MSADLPDTLMLRCAVCPRIPASTWPDRRRHTLSADGAYICDECGSVYSGRRQELPATPPPSTDS